MAFLLYLKRVVECQYIGTVIGSLHHGVQYQEYCCREISQDFLRQRGLGWGGIMTFSEVIDLEGSSWSI